MATLALALPCLPGGAQALRELADACNGSRRREFEAFHRRVGLTEERWYLQQTPQGEIFILTLAGDPEGAIAKLRGSDHPFDRWFKEQARAVHGIDFDQPLPGPPPEQIFAG